ncbi:hypothetical protein METH_10525 [Leisingera methylohalidivorans DSM 14336]|uniref:Uncharacterized protein n=1 Tax=Leisingera methylohalidivorans DSM 14336 TaxID=999552 RepID=V9W1L7_9RHOB|nr:hypothetical protein METH_10525 [Leisingera methylohalidivorans DSM 14336]
MEICLQLLQAHTELPPLPELSAILPKQSAGVAYAV